MSRGPLVDRQRLLHRLREDVARARQELARTGLEIGDLTAIESARRLTRDEAARGTALRREQTRLFYELAMLRQEFLQLQEQRGAAPRTRTAQTLRTTRTTHSTRVAGGT
jgi:hypothetical protein